MKTRYEQIVNVEQIGKSLPMDMNAIFALAENEQFNEAKKDYFLRRLLLCIDMQKDFMEGGALGVPGSVADVERITRFIYNNMGEITKIICSLDTHMPHQIFHPCWWVNPKGEHPAPYIIITYNDIKEGKWRATKEPVKSYDYVKMIEYYGKKQLCIWPYHCIHGTEGANLENEFAKMVYFHSVARKSVNTMLPKGMDACSEMYGIIEPEFSENNFKNTGILNAIELYDEIYICGEAASHCVLESLIQVCKHFTKRPEVLKKITILEDCMSPIPGFEAETQKIFNNLRKNYGINFKTSTEICFANLNKN